MNPKSHLPELETLESSNKRSRNLKNWAIAVIILAFVGVFILPFLITHFSWVYDLGTSKPNEIGDTIGGILSPFIGLVSAILIYITIDQQIEANRKIQGQIDQGRLDKLEELIFEETKKELEKLKTNLERFKNLDYESTRDDPSRNPYADAMDYLIFREGGKGYNDIHEGCNVLENHLDDFLKIMNLFSEKVKKQDAYKIIIKKMSADFLPFFESRKLREVFFGLNLGLFKDSPFPEDFINLSNHYTLESIKELMEVRIYIYSDKNNNDENSTQFEIDSIDLLEEIIDDIKQYKSFEYAFNMRQLERLGVRIKTEDSSYTGLDEDYQKFRQELKEKGWYAIEEKWK
ncbi:hypothetical protein [Arcticibacterium luteifluviistationis]|uniref:Phage abortive infection protein n=1 Tax=Arcticibacterium luteifluviistationis TaxID=1784714 RepID=A0A2Z4GFE3_9BACT|nr:hypothetical protein [Arcticibacterium luteifluviistationis]AWW00103.1 hypothetical protein DJ013_18785 [Arcticibacterium luteifluviistationis]